MVAGLTSGDGYTWSSKCVFCFTCVSGESSECVFCFTCVSDESSECVYCFTCVSKEAESDHHVRIHIHDPLSVFSASLVLVLSKRKSL